MNQTSTLTQENKKNDKTINSKKCSKDQILQITFKKITGVGRTSMVENNFNSWNNKRG